MTKIYTKTGDKGTTGLANGERVLKNSERIETYGTVDELNSIVGICALQLDYLEDENALQLKKILFAIQNDLFNLGSDLATPLSSRFVGMKIISDVEVTQIEKIIDFYHAKLPPLRNFVLPGGSMANCSLHLARTVCRRVERLVVGLGQNTEINPFAVKYFNRLSDLFFTLARFVQHSQKLEEIEWQKQAGMSELKLSLP